MLLPRRQSVRLMIGLGAIVISAGPVSAEDHSTQGRLLVANKGSRNLSVVDVAKGSEIAVIAEDGITGHEVIASPDGRLAYVPIFGNSGVGRPGTDGQLIRVIDLTQEKIVGTVDFGRGMRPHCPLIHPRTGELYVTTEIENSVSIIDPKTLTVVGSIPTGQPQSHMLAISHDGRRGYTANVEPGTVSVLDLEKRALLKTIQAAVRVQRVSISPDDRWVVTADQTKLRLVVIDTRSNEVAASIPLPGLGYGTAFTSNGRWLLVALPSLRKVGFVDWGKRQVVATVDVPKAPQNVLIQPGDARAFVSCDSSAQVAVIDLASRVVEKLIPVGPGADGLAWAEALNRTGPFRKSAGSSGGCRCICRIQVHCEPEESRPLSP